MRTREVNTWILQRGYAKPSVVSVLDEHKIPYVYVDPIPFSDGEFKSEPPSFCGPCVIHGTNALIRASIKRGWSPGAFFSHDSTFTTWKKYLSEHLLNADSTTMRLGDALPLSLKNNLFIRPNNDFKDFTGRTFEYEELADFLRNTEMHDLEVNVCSVKKVKFEWRTFIVDGRVVAASQYAPKGDSYVVPEILDFARQMHQIWSPHLAYVLDICDLDGELKIVEYNCITGSGLYCADVEAIVLALSHVSP